MKMRSASVPAKLTWRVALHRVPLSIWALGLTSMFMDISSELVHSLLPIYMSSVLGASMLTIGLVEGVAEATASMTKVFSGALSDHWRRRKPLAVLGYGLSALTKPMFPLAASIGWVAAARFTDRIGKGIRGAPRDALIADMTPTEIHGAAYGLRQALDSAGAFLGPLLAMVLMIRLNSIRSVLWVAAVPAVIAVVVLFAGVQEPDPSAERARAPFHFRAVRGLGRSYWLIVALAAVFTLARFSEAFLILRAQTVGLSMAYVPLVMIVMNAAFMAGAYPAGAASDRMGERKLLLAGLAALIVSHLILARASAVPSVLAGASAWGLHMALTHGLLSKMVAGTAPESLRGTAFGIFNLAAGLAALFASFIAGALWTAIGPSATFFAGAVFAAAAAIGLLVNRSPDRAWL